MLCDCPEREDKHLHIKNSQIAFTKITVNDIVTSYKLHKEYCSYLRSLGVKISTTPFEDHRNFVMRFLNDPSHPYKNWYMVDFDGEKIGYVVIKKTNEFGYVIFKKYRGYGIGSKMFVEFFKIHPRNTLWARSRKENKRSHHMLEKFGFEVTDLEFH